MKNFFSQLPSPWELIQDSASIVVISIFFILMITEEIAPGRKLPHIKFWKFKGVIAFILYFFLSTYLPLIWGKYLEEYSVFDLRRLGDYWGALVALLLYELGVFFITNFQSSLSALPSRRRCNHPSNLESADIPKLFRFCCHFCKIKPQVAQ